MRYTPLFVALTALACGGGSSSDSSATSPQAMNALAQEVSTAASAYDAMAARMSSVADCSSGESQYDAQVRPHITQLHDMGPQMDMMMGSLGSPADADMTCAADAMMAELDHHRSMACSSPTDMGPNVSEAHRHAAAMIQWASHEMARTSAMGTMMGSGMGGMPGGGMSTGHCVKNGDGSYSMP